jgi:hypothetical protein
MAYGDGEHNSPPTPPQPPPPPPNFPLLLYDCRLVHRESSLLRRSFHRCEDEALLAGKPGVGGDAASRIVIPVPSHLDLAMARHCATLQDARRYHFRGNSTIVAREGKTIFVQRRFPNPTKFDRQEEYVVGAHVA